MASLESEMRRIKKLADDHATATEGATRTIHETGAWWDSLSRRQRLAELRASVAEHEAAIRCPHHLHALLLRAGELQRRDFLKVDVARAWDVARLDYGGDSVSWQDFYDVLAEVAAGIPGDAASRETLPACPVCTPDACAPDDQIAQWIRPLPLEKWILLVLLGQRLDWRDPVPSIETQWRWVTGQEPVPTAQEQHHALPIYATPPAAWADAWAASQRDLADVLASSPTYKTIVAGTRSYSCL